MQIRHLSIKNFRGIQELDWVAPENNVICLIGRGDSTKSTILEAIRYALFPAWNPSFNEFDYFQTDTTADIEIAITLGDLPEEFLSDNKYGLYLRGWNKESALIADEPAEGLESVITALLSIDKNLEPKWNVICERFSEGTLFRVSDRAKACATYIGAYADTHLTWNKNSALSRITEAENITGLLSDASRAARETLDDSRDTKLANFDSAASTAEGIAKSFGVPVSAEGAYRAQLDTGAINIRAGGLSLHDQSIPLRRLGLGSRRMLTFGIQQAALNESHITLIDEVEIGLEPHRISRLLKKLNEDDSGQYFITTHSPVVLRELTIEQLSVVQKKLNHINVSPVSSPAINDNIQGKIRKGAEAFLAKKVIVCEGATEVGLCRGLDGLWSSQDIEPFSFHGVAMFDAGGGSNIKPTAEALHELGYDVFVIGDSDADDGFSEAHATGLRGLGVGVVRWEGDVSIEEYFFEKLSWSNVLASVNLAIEMYGERALQQVKEKFQKELDGNVASWEETDELRKAIGRASLGSNGKNAWFKRQDRAEEWTEKIAADLNNATALGAHIENIRWWVVDA